MRTYNKTFMKRSHDRRVERLNKPDMDAIVWNVDENNHLAYVRVQGSSTNIPVDINRNQTNLPYEVKRGNAVQLRFIGGKRRYQIVGIGKSIPTPVAGAELPTAEGLPDTILSGFTLGVLCGGMYISVTSGTFRLNGTTYSFLAPTTDPDTMDSPPPMVMDTTPDNYMGSGPHCVGPISIPSAGYGRYDALTISSDLTIDVEQGTPGLLSSGEPSKPNASANHVLIAHVFVHSEMTAFTSDNLAQAYIAPDAALADITPSGVRINSDEEFTWDTGDDYPECDITVSIEDHYGNSYSIGNDWCTITKEVGSGDLYSSETGLYGSTARKRCTTSTVFKYRRDQTASPESTPVFTVAFDNNAHLQNAYALVLLDSSGDQIA